MIIPAVQKGLNLLDHGRLVHPNLVAPENPLVFTY